MQANDSAEVHSASATRSVALPERRESIRLTSAGRQRPSLPDLVEPFRVEVHHGGKTVRIALSGKSDLATVGQVAERLEELTASGSTRIVLDLRTLTSGIGA